MELEFVTKALKELGHETRLRLYKCIVRAGHQGIAVGQLQESLAIPGSTLSHHIASLVAADLVHQRREGRTLYCVAQYDTLTGVIDYLQQECCADECED
ncbi:hypothetical protein VST7929_01210 [Vibrio stylophorae]|uniref:HTH arsR-type domain-containing protein n=1 Tax=Vibrio stylophorae TaxID=659351 RepID=A0ABM8ZSU9_9VIBR|nr:metalloregulator ArsR/SmtB family transcription factor [Vibrio stylophorae]CAH0533344.1 hypothetical protein VST7929_01210 [Vibrio stylophorae]